MTQNDTKPVRSRRRYRAQIKAELLAEYLAGGVFLASLAMGHDINPNVLHRWVREHERYGRHSLDNLHETIEPQGGRSTTPANWIPINIPNTAVSERALAMANPRNHDGVSISQ